MIVVQASAIALILPLAWEFPYAVGKAVKRRKKNGKKEIRSICLDDEAIQPSWGSLFFFFFFWSFCLFRPVPVAYGGSQARGLIGPIAAGLHQSHSNDRSEPCLPPTPQLMQTPNP